MRKKQQFGFLLAGVEFISTELLKDIEKRKKTCLNFGLGVFSDELFESIYNRKPLKSYEERAHLANSLKGVDSVWEVKSLSDNIDKKIYVEPAIYVSNTVQKKYHVVYAPGTYDLLHEGHLDHLRQCREMGDVLIVGVKSDENVWETKHKKTHQSEQERLQIVRSLDFVDNAILVVTHDKHWANEHIKKLIGHSIDVVVLGSDCEGQEKYDNPDGLPFVFTHRDPQVALKRSSSYYRAELDKQQNSNKEG